MGADAFNRDLDEAQPAPAKPAVNRNGKKDKPFPKRVCLRPQRLKWTPDEINQLVKGVAIYGMGKWKKILNHPEFNFQKGRTPVDLKDR